MMAKADEFKSIISQHNEFYGSVSETPIPVQEIMQNMSPGESSLKVFDHRTSSFLDLIQSESISFHHSKDIKKHLSEKYKVSETCIITNCETVNKKAVITKVGEKNEFLAINHLYCMRIDDSLTVNMLIQAIRNKMKTNIKEKICLLIRKKIVKDSEIKVTEMSLNNLCACTVIVQQSVVLKFHYHVAPNKEVLYDIECTNTDTFKEIKEKFLCNFATDFPDSNGELFFSHHTHIFEDDDFLFSPETILMNGLESQLCIKENITIQIKREYSIPVVVIDTNNRVKIVILTEHNVSTEELRHQIGKYLKKPPSSLKLKVDDKKILDVDNIASLNTFTTNREIHVTSLAKKTFKIVMMLPDGRTVDKNIDMFKYEKVFQLRQYLASSVGHKAFQLEMTYSGAQMEDDKILAEYHIREDQQIEINVYENRAKIYIKCSGQALKSIIIDDPHKTNILQVKHFLSKMFSMDVFEMNIIFKGRSLNNDEILDEVGVKDSDRLIVCKSPHSERYNAQGIFRTIFTDKDGKAHSDKAVIKYEGKLYPVALGIPEKNKLPGFYKQHEQIITRGIHLVERKLDKRIISDVPHHHQQLPDQCEEDSMMTETESSFSRSTEAVERKNEPQNTVSSGVSPHLNPPHRLPDLSEHEQTMSDTSSPVERKSENVICTSPSRHQINTFDNSNSHTPSSSSKNVVLKNTGILRVTTAEGSVEFISEQFCTVPITHSQSLPELFQMCRSHLTSSVSMSALPLDDPSKCKMQHIINFLSRNLGNDWEMFGYHLGMEKNYIDKCKCEHPGNLETQIHSMLLYWQQKNGSSATKEKLIEALKEYNLNSLAEQIETDNFLNVH